MRFQNPMAQYLPVNAEIDSFLGTIFPEVHGPNLIQNLFFAFRQSFLLKKVLIPGRNHHFETEGIETLQVLMQTPAEGSVPEMNQANIAHFSHEIAAPPLIDFELDGDRNRAVVGPGHMSETMMHMGGNRRWFEVEIRDKVDREGYC